MEKVKREKKYKFTSVSTMSQQANANNLQKDRLNISLNNVSIAVDFYLSR